MTTALRDCERKAKRLPVAERALLVERLISSLDSLDEVECERLWLAEAERRYAGYKAGEIPARSAEDVFRDARASLVPIR